MAYKGYINLKKNIFKFIGVTIVVPMLFIACNEKNKPQKEIIKKKRL